MCSYCRISQTRNSLKNLFLIDESEEEKLASKMIKNLSKLSEKTEKETNFNLSIKKSL